ncbi:MAG: DUF456 domain-containing protein [Mediterranea massiliensis]|nr:DUF456 domain-containing protein [Mediterranea massiliensis]
MEILLIIIGVVCLIVGLAGCILPMLPGPPVAYAALILLHLTSEAEFSAFQLTVWLILVILSQLLDYVIPMLGSKYTGGSQWGARGCLLGTIIGLFFMPWGIILGPFLGAVVGELLAGNDSTYALKSGIGSLLGFLLGTVIKCILCGYFAWQFFSTLIV